MKCKRCGSYSINHNSYGRDGSDPDLCDVCYWRKRAERYFDLLKDCHKIIPGNSGNGDLSRMQRTWADVTKVVKEGE